VAPIAAETGATAAQRKVITGCSLWVGAKEDRLITFLGIWVDQKKAFIARLQAQDSFRDVTPLLVSVTRVDSELNGTRDFTVGHAPARYHGGHKTWLWTIMLTHGKEQRLKGCYVQLVEQLQDAEKILLMGPGEARFESLK
jgi:hypothetical protein